MTAAVLYGKEQLRIETVDVPRIGKGDVLVRVRAALTCGTDVKVFRRGYHARMIQPPALFGHELAGDIVAVGLPELWQLAIQRLRRGGVANFFGGCPAGTRVSLDTNLLHYSELTCMASFHHIPALVRKALEVISRSSIRAKDFVNRVEPLANLLQVMQHLMSHNGHLKTAIIP